MNKLLLFFIVSFSLFAACTSAQNRRVEIAIYADEKMKAEAKQDAGK